jgi:hypothetical protein
MNRGMKKKYNLICTYLKKRQTLLHFINVKILFFRRPGTVEPILLGQRKFSGGRVLCRPAL